MDWNEARTMGVRMLDEARALRAAFPDVGAMCRLTVSAVPPGTSNEDAAASALRAALGYLRDEMLLVRAGRIGDLTVLDDEIAHTEGLLLRH
jgi:hypothetical protein